MGVGGRGLYPRTEVPSAETPGKRLYTVLLEMEVGQKNGLVCGFH